MVEVDAMNAENIISILQDKGIVSNDQLKQARERVENEESSNAINALIELGFVKEETVMKEYAELYGMGTIDLEKATISDEALRAVPPSTAREYKILPVRVEEGLIEIVMSDPSDIETLDTLGFLLNAHVEAVIAPQKKIDQYIEHYYGNINENVDSFVQNLQQGDSIEDHLVQQMTAEADENAGDQDDSAPIIKLVTKMITEAVKKRASDIHVEPLQDKFRVRYRIDGVLQEVDNPPKYLQRNILSRIKIMSKLDISEKRVPQDGRIQIKTEGRYLDLRVSTIPSSHGESIVMRILDKSNVMLDIASLGFLDDDIKAINEILNKPDGIFLVTGPTGSGKTTSLYSFLHAENEPTRKIITVEDPVEYHLEGINQVQVNRQVDMTFGRALRSILRQAPSIVMVGEIRDGETAEIATNAALTGHLVFSTLHTNDAPGAITRIIDIGVKPYMVASSVRAVMAQRLVRTVCKSCAVSYEPTQEEVEYLELPPDFFSEGKLMKGRGCTVCNNTGYKGRLGIYELFQITEEIQNLIFKGASRQEIKEAARRGGMRTLREDGLKKVLNGQTTIDEVIRVTVAEQ